MSETRIRHAFFPAVRGEAAQAPDDPDLTTHPDRGAGRKTVSNGAAANRRGWPRAEHGPFLPGLMSAILATTALTGCGAPSFNLFGDRYEHQNADGAPETIGIPTVNDVVDHTACELSHALYKHLGDPNGGPGGYDFDKASPPTARDKADTDLWNHIIQDNFVASVDLELQVTDAQSFNPSANFITPFNPLVQPSATMAAGSSFTGNFTLAVGAQLSGTQYRTFELNYVINLSNLFHRMRWDFWQNRQDEVPPYLRFVPADPQHPKPAMRLDTEWMSRPCEIPLSSSHTQLTGDLGMDQVLAGGLASIRKVKYFSLYATNVDGKDAVTAGAPAPRPGPEIQPELLFQPGQHAKPAPKPGVTKKTAKTPPDSVVSFDSELDFTIVGGFNVGPNWTLTHFTGPSGGGGGGGSRAGGGGGGGGSGGGGGMGGGSANQGLINLNRTALDTIHVTVAATCRFDKSENSAKPKEIDDTYWDVVPICGSEGARAASGAVQNRFDFNTLGSRIRRALR